jgi:hypothetical protein
MRFYQLDNDTKKYIKRLNYNGIKTPADIYSVDQFIRGLKDLGIYGNMIEAWFFRKNHNAGSGNILYSFRDSFNNGTINSISTAVWNDRGLICTPNATNSLSNYITGNLKTNTLNNCSIFSIFMSNSPMENFTSGYPYVFSLTNLNGYRPSESGASFSILSYGQNGNTWSSSFNDSSNALNIQGNTLYKIIKGSFNPSQIKVESRNSSSTTTSATGTNLEKPLIYNGFVFNGRINNYGSPLTQGMNGNYGVGFQGTQIFNCFFDIDVNFVSFESLFKSTIGKGIDLP